MAHLVRFEAPRRASVVDVEVPAPAPGEVLIRTLYSGISAGTELTAYRGSNPYLAQEWDPARRIFVPGASTHSYPLDGWGYEEVGEIVAIGDGVSPEHVGRQVWGAWGHRSHAVRPLAYAEARFLPRVDDPIVGIFGKIGAIALNAILDADIHVGETVVVFGGGVPGQIIAQLARVNGARVILVDPILERRSLAEKLGAWRVLDPTTVSVAEQVRSVTDDRGADVVIEVSGSYHALQEAIRTVAYSSRVVTAGFFQGEGHALRLGEEFHHNRVQIIGSQISGVSPSLQHRWDELRMSSAVLQLAGDGRVDLTSLISHVLPAHSAPAAFEMLDERPQEALQVVLDYREV